MALAIFAGLSASAGWAQTPAPPTKPVEVDSWALSPAGSDNPNKNGDRPSLGYEAAPGGVIKDAVTLFNLGNVQLTFRLYATDGFNNPDGGFDVLAGDQKPTDIGTWVTLPQANITVPPHKQATIPIEVKVPANARPGDHAGAILASNAALGTATNGKLITLDRRTGPRLYVRVAGALVPELSIEKVHSVYRPALNPLGGTVDLSYRVVNKGNVRLGARQSVSVGGVLGLGSKHRRPKDLAELLPGQGATVTMSVSGVPATVIDNTSIRATPMPVAGATLGKAASKKQRAVMLALPVTLITMVLVAALVLIARRSYVRHQAEMRAAVPEHTRGVSRL